MAATTRVRYEAGRMADDYCRILFHKTLTADGKVAQILGQDYQAFIATNIRGLWQHYANPGTRLSDLVDS